MKNFIPIMLLLCKIARNLQIKGASTMLLQFGVRNFRSIRDEHSLSLVASNLKDDPSGLLDATQASSGLYALPAALIYGPNASGKTNFYRALRFMQQAVTHSHTKGSPEGGVPVKQFMLFPEGKADPKSEFEIDFIVDGIRFNYGFSCDQEQFYSEWLYSYPLKQPRTVFHREGNDFKFGREFGKESRLIRKITRPNSLFISAASQNNSEAALIVHDFFKSIKFNNEIASDPAGVAFKYKDRDIDPRAIRFLTLIGTGIVDADIKKSPLEEQQVAIRDRITKAILDSVSEEIEISTSDENIEISLGHERQFDAPVFFELSDESAGTLRLLSMMSDIFKALDQGTVVAVDELDASLHTQVAEAIFCLFQEPNINQKGAQLIATTHDTNLLSSKSLRRDQVWLVEKSREGASALVALTDYATRKSDNLEIGYLQGRYGATHSLHDLRRKIKEIA